MEQIEGESCFWSPVSLAATFAEAFHRPIAIEYEFYYKNKRVILITTMYIALFAIGNWIYILLDKGLNLEESLILQFSGLVSSSLLAIGCFWELYFAKYKDIQ